jgi:hypothetical protein
MSLSKKLALATRQSLPPHPRQIQRQRPREFQALQHAAVLL